MTSRIKRSLAAAALAFGLAGGGTLLSFNTHLIASTADAGQPNRDWTQCPIFSPASCQEP